MAKSSTFEKYGAQWNSGTDPLHIEFFMVRQGEAHLQERGRSLFYHYKNIQRALWPEDSENRWSDLILREILANKFTAVIGPGSSGKTYQAAKFALTEYFVYPEDSLFLISSTDVRGLELRVYGALKSLWMRAKERWDNCPGNIIDYLHAITTDDIAEGVRDLRKGIVAIPCLSSSGAYKGLGKWIGVKQKRVRLISDECQVMHDTFLEAIPNLNTNPDFKAVFLGNPLGVGDPLDKVSEPVGGWSSHPQPEKTCTWKTRFHRGICVQLVGTDSPNEDEPKTAVPRFPYLINARMIDEVVAFYGRHSAQYYSQCLGIRVTGLVDRKIITRVLCEQFHAFDDCVWLGDTTTKIVGIDAAYGGDRCVMLVAEFGKDINKRETLTVSQPIIIPVIPRGSAVPEDQIAAFVRDHCIGADIPPTNVFYDSTGRGSLGTSFARLWSADVNPVEFGGPPTARPVRNDLYIRDPRTGERRLKLAHEHYGKFVSELWFAVRYTIETGQMRRLAQEICDEASQREWIEMPSGKIDVEKKVDMKKRVGRSPDLTDALATAIEGARRKGFTIAKLSAPDQYETDQTWRFDLRKRALDLRASYTLIR